MMKKKPIIHNIIVVLILFFCNTPLMAQSPEFQWVRQDVDSSSYMYSVTTDKEGNVYTTGAFSGTVDFNPGSSSGKLTSKGSSDGYICKMDGDGKLIWVKQLECTDLCYGSSIAVDDSGNVYICGGGTGTIDLNPGVGASNITIQTKAPYFFAKYDASGNFIWGTPTGQVGTKPWAGSVGIPMAIGRSGSIYFSGVALTDSITFGVGTGIASAYAKYHLISGTVWVPYPIIFIGKLDASGKLSWVHSYATDYDFANTSNVVTDKDENIYLTGSYGASVDFDPGPDTTLLTSNGKEDIFALKMSKEGKLLWAESMGGAGDDRGTSIAIDGCGDIYVAGDFKEHPADFDPGPDQYIIRPVENNIIPNFFLQDIYITKLDANGGFIWTKIIGGPWGENTPYLALNAYGSLYITGRAGDGTDFNPDTSIVYNLPNLSSQAWGTFMAKLSIDGRFSWAGGLIKPSGQLQPFPWGINTGDLGNMYIFGAFRDTTDFDPGSKTHNLIANKIQDNFLLKLSDPGFVMPSYDTTAMASCDSLTVGTSTLTSSGIYKLNLISSAGCDSIAVINLIINHIIPATINVHDFTLGTASTYATYQWYLEGTLIPGATQSTYTVTQNGNYTVIVTDTNGCIDTSDVYTVNNYTGIGDVNETARQIDIYPNPANTSVTINSKSGLGIQTIKIMNMLGAELSATSGDGRQKQTLNVSYLPPAIYLLRIETDKGTVVRKLEIMK